LFQNSLFKSCGADFDLDYLMPISIFIDSYCQPSLNSSSISSKFIERSLDVQHVLQH